MGKPLLTVIETPCYLSRCKGRLTVEECRDVVDIDRKIIKFIKKIV